MPMNILYICFSSAWGGLEKYAVKLACDQQKSGHNLLFVCRKGTASEREIGKTPVKYRSFGHLKYIDLPLMLRIRNLINEGGFNIVHAHNSQDLGVIVPALIGLNDVKLFFSLHMVVPAPKKDIYHRFQYGRVEKIFALGLEGKESAERNLPISSGKVMELPYGMDLKKYSPGRAEALRKNLGFKDNDLVLGVLSRLEPLKGQMEAVRALPAIKAKHPTARLLLIGDETEHMRGKEKKRILKKVKELGISDYVTILPYQRDVPEYLRCMDVFLLPSHFESYSISAIEAKLTALPIVGASSGGVPQNLGYGEYGVLVKPKDHQSLAEGVLAVLDDIDSAKQKGQKARTDALERYDQDKILKTLENEYRKATE